MARFPGATYREVGGLDRDKPITPVGVILHVAVSEAPSLFNYFNGPSGGIESHFYIRRDGTTEQYRDTGREADANLKANSFYQGGKWYGFLSVETQGMGPGEWTPQQLDEIKRLILWAHSVHGVPLRVCPDPYSGGVGYHTMFGAPGPWTPVSKDCPGPDRIRQFKDVLVPWLTNPGNPQTKEWWEMPIPPEELAKIAEAVWTADRVAAPARTNTKLNPYWPANYHLAHVGEWTLAAGDAALRVEAALKAITAQLGALAAAVAALAKNSQLTAEQITAAAKAGADQALEERITGADVTLHVDPA